MKQRIQQRTSSKTSRRQPERKDAAAADTWTESAAAESCEEVTERCSGGGDGVDAGVGESLDRGDVRRFGERLGSLSETV